MAIQAIELKVDTNASALAALGARLKAEEGGVILRRELVAGLRAAAAPAVADAKAGALVIKRSTSVGRSLAAHIRRQERKPVAERKGFGGVESLGAAVARQIGVQVRTGARTAGVTVRARKRDMPRDFVNAPKRLNAKKWRHPVFHTGDWVDQVGNPDFFDGAMRRTAPAARAACIQCVEAMAARLAR